MTIAKLKKDKNDLSPDTNFSDLYKINLDQGLESLNTKVKKGNINVSSTSAAASIGDQVPSSNLTHDLGSAQNKWRSVFSKDYYNQFNELIYNFNNIAGIDATQINDSLAISSSDKSLDIEIDDKTIDFRVNVPDTITGSLTIDQNLNVLGNITTGKIIRGAMNILAYAATISLDSTLANMYKTTTVNATGNATINATTGGLVDQEMTILIINDATSGKIITFGTNFKSSGTITGTASKVAVIKFISDGVSFYEVTRTLAL